MEEKKILIVGAGNVGKKVLSQAIKHRLDAVIVMPPDDSFTVKDKRYTKRPNKPHNNGFMHNLLKGTYKQYFANEFTYLEDSYIIYEYRLTQDKKCNLSSSKRKKIVSEFNRRFELI